MISQVPTVLSTHAAYQDHGKEYSRPNICSAQRHSLSRPTSILAKSWKGQRWSTAKRLGGVSIIERMQDVVILYAIRTVITTIHRSYQKKVEK